MKTTTKLFALTVLAVSAMTMPQTAAAENTVQHFGSNSDKSWAASSSTTDILSGSTVTIDGVVMTFGGTDNYWTWSNNLLLSNNMVNDGTNGITTIAVNDVLPTHGGIYTFAVSKDGYLTVTTSEANAGDIFFGETTDGKAATVKKDTKGSGKVSHTYEVSKDKSYYFFQAARNATTYTSYRNSFVSFAFEEPATITIPEITGYHTWNFIEESSTWNTRTTPNVYDELALTGTFSFDNTNGRYVIAANADGAIQFKVKETGYLVIMGKSTASGKTFNLTVGATTTSICKGSSGLVHCQKIEATEATLVKLSASSDGGVNVFAISWIPENSTQDTNTKSVTLDSKGFATYYPAYTVAIPEGVKAYYVSAIDATEGTITTGELTDKIPAHAAVILTGEGGQTYNFSAYRLGSAFGAYSYNSAASGAATNVLHGVYKSGMATDGTKNFFAYKKDAGMFAKASSGLTLPEGRCYFTTATSAPAREFRIGLVDDGGETTGISDAQGTASNIGHYYTLNGQRVNQPQHGIYVTNGKKIIKK